MDAFVIAPLPLSDDSFEVVERKGLGHPDTICDALAEALSRALCREYRRRFGTILHHNVDKALLSGGRAAPAFGGGVVLDPIDIHLGGRAVREAAGETIALERIAVESAREWLAANLHALDPVRHVRIHQHIQPGSLDLQNLFAGDGVTRANDTSIAVAHAPLSALERLVLAVEERINGGERAARHPAWGEDVKVMGLRRGGAAELVIACAMIGRHLARMDDYLAEKTAVAELARGLAAEHGFADCRVGVNLADSPGSAGVYLTVTGTSAEAGDDGEVGRGNRVNGLITPCRPMSLEAAAGKNPVSHVGKIYNVLAQQIAQALVASTPEIVQAECLMVSKIGSPVDDPAIVRLNLATADGAPAARFQEHARAITAAHLSRLPQLVDALVAGEVELF